MTKIPIDKIITNPNQVRKSFNKDKLKELADSIKINGLLQNIGVRKTNNHYDLVFGERRLKAHELLGLDEIECNIMNINDKDVKIYSLIENIIRDDITILEKAEGLKELFVDQSTRSENSESGTDDINNLLEVISSEKIIKDLNTLRNTKENTNKSLTNYELELDDLCNQVSMSARQITDYLKISTLSDNTKAKFPNHKLNALLEIYKSEQFIKKQIEADKIKEEEDYQANKDKPQTNFIHNGQSVHDSYDIKGHPLNDNIKYPNKSPDEKTTNDTYSPQYFTDKDESISKNHERANKELISNYDNLSEKYKNDSKGLSDRLKIVNDTPIEHKAKVSINDRAAKIVDTINNSELKGNKEFLDKELESMPDEDLLKKHINNVKSNEALKPKMQITAEKVNKESTDKAVNKFIKELNSVSIENMSKFNDCDDEQKKKINNKINLTIDSLKGKVIE